MLAPEPSVFSTMRMGPALLVSTVLKDRDFIAAAFALTFQVNNPDMSL